MQYPSNDITTLLQQTAASGGTVTLSQDSVVHQVVKILNPFILDLNGYTLQAYGRSEPVIIDNVICTGPAGWFLDANGKPIARRWDVNITTKKGLSSASANIFSTPPTGVNGITIKNGIFDDNVVTPIKYPLTYSTDVWTNAVFFPNINDTNVNISNLEIINAYGGYITKTPTGSHIMCPDPIHVASNGQVVSNYKLGLRDVIPVSYGGPSVLEIASGTTPVNNVLIENVESNGYLECDGTLYNSQITNYQGTFCRIGTRTPSGSWGGTVWNNIQLSRPNGNVLYFPSGSSFTDWQITNSTFDGIINNPNSFQGTWGPNNNPSTIGGSYSNNILIGIVIIGVIIFLLIYVLS